MSVGPPHGRIPRAGRWLLRLLPASLRERFGADMEELLGARLAEARTGRARAGVWLRAAADVGGAVVAECIDGTRAWRDRGMGGMDGWGRDLRHAARALVRAPALSAVVVLTLGLGIGASTATFSVVNGVLLKPLPYVEPDRLVAVWPGQTFNTAMTRALAARAPALEAVSGISGWAFTLTGEGEPLQLDGARVSPGHFRLLGVRPVLGRDFTEADGVPGQDAVAILSHGLWVRVFGGDPGVVGRTVELATNDAPRRTIVGVLPPDFRPVAGAAEVWIPLAVPPSTAIPDDGTWYLNPTVARLAPGATLEQAAEQVRGFAGEVHALMDQAITERSAADASVRPLHAHVAGEVGPVMWTALGAAALVLLIACANVANLLLARGDRRRGDLAVRAALGADRSRILRTLLLESGLLGAAGGLLGLALAHLLVHLVLDFAPETFPRRAEIGIDPRVLAFALAATAFTAMLAGFVPAVRAARGGGAEGLGGGTGRARSAARTSRLATGLVGAQVALAVIVVIGSGLMLASLGRVTSEDPGLHGAGVVVFRPSPPEGRYPDGRAFHAYYAEVLEQVRALPAVDRASAIHLLPGTPNNWNFPTFIEGVPVEPGTPIPAVNFRAVWPGYFETVGIERIRGRTLEPSDDAASAPVVVVNEAFAARYWPGEDPIGRALRVLSTDAEPHRVVGVVGDVRQHGLGLEPVPEMYFTHAQIPWNMAFWVVARVRGSESALAHAPALREAVWSVDADVPITGMAELSDVLSESAATTRFLAATLSAFGLLALVLAAVGVFGVTSYGVGRRTAEFGVRIALGASRPAVLAAAVRGTLGAVLAGLVLGLGAASLTSDFLASALYEIEPTDPGTFLAVPAVLLVVATLAAVVPAWRAARIDPATALRDE